ncbi:MAG: ABC transporter ATP-binding protein [Candidatus Sericytochromatia bacterium]|nr:ABC transporter ATP-binding protein [Candidatus Sericytochromatia bacterium]
MSPADAKTPILRVAGVTKTYPGRLGRTSLTAVRDVSFDVHPGEILGLLGPNGAGKSTTLKMVTGLLRPTTGHIAIAGVNVADRRSQAVQRLGAVLEGNRNLHWKLTARENLRYFGALKGVGDLARRVDAVIDQLGLTPHAVKRVGELSRGLQQRVAIGVALLGEPQVLVLDEPTLGLDVIAGSEFQRVVRGIAERGCAIVLTTHQMEVAEALSQRIAIIAGGRLAALDSLAALRGAYRSPGYEVVLHGSLAPETWAAIEAAGGEACEAMGAATTFRVRGGDPAALYRSLEPLRDAAVELHAVKQLEIDLEGVYRRVVGEVAR